MHKRVNITLPEETLRLIDRAAKKGYRSHFIDEAVRHFAKERSRVHLKARLKEGAQKRARRDLVTAREWFLLEEESWPPHGK